MASLEALRREMLKRGLSTEGNLGAGLLGGQQTQAVNPATDIVNAFRTRAGLGQIAGPRSGKVGDLTKILLKEQLRRGRPETASERLAEGRLERLDEVDPGEIRRILSDIGAVKEEPAGRRGGFLGMGEEEFLTTDQQRSIRILEEALTQARGGRDSTTLGIAGQTQEFNSVEEAEAANLPQGTKITIQGRSATVQ